MYLDGIRARGWSRDYESIASRRPLEEYNTAAVTIIELANNEVMHENAGRLPAHVILENHRMSNRGWLPAANTSGDFTGERWRWSHLKHDLHRATGHVYNFRVYSPISSLTPNVLCPDPGGIRVL